MQRLLLALLLPPLQACVVSSLTGDDRSEWYEVGPVQKPLEEVVSATRDVILRQGYKLPGPVDPRALRLATAWDVHVSPHWREGYRTKVEAEFDVIPDGRGILVRVRSFREVNNEAGTPTILERAQWVSASLDPKHENKIPEPAMKIRQLLKFKLEARS
jgi:hypothetical protein